MGGVRTRPKKNIETNTDDLISQLIEAVTDTYLNPPENTADENGRMYLNLLAEEFSMTPIKVRKLLISSGVYQTDISKKINELYKSGKSIFLIRIFRDLSLWRENGKSVKQDNDRYGGNNRVYVSPQGTIPIRELFIGMINSNLQTMFTDVNQKTSEIAVQVGQTPQGWNGSLFSMIQGLSNNVIVPIAGIIITMVLCYELISLLTERNNLHEVDTWMFFKYFVKMWVAVYLVSNTFNIVMAVFDVGQSVVRSAAGYINGSTAINVNQMIATMNTAMEAMGIPELMMLAIETALIRPPFLKTGAIFSTISIPPFRFSFPLSIITPT